MTIIGKVRKGNAGKAFGYIVVMALCAIAMSPKSMASTVAYWPLTQANGVRTTTSTVFANEGDGVTMDAMPVTIRTSTGEINASNTINCYPIGTNAFPAAFGVYDPVAGENLPCATGLDFDARYFTSNWNTSNSTSIPRYSCWWKGALRVTDPDALKLSTFTVEIFVRPNPAMKSYYQFIAAMPLGNATGNTMGKESWSIAFDDNGRMYAAFTISGTRKIYFPSAAMPNFFDGRWHHMAITVSGTALKMYADYALVGSGTLDGEVEYLEDGDLFIGAPPHHSYSYHGSMAHFRVSDEALTPDKFLHFTRTERAANEANDVVLHINFETVDGISTNNIVFNQAATGSAVHLSDTNKTTYAEFDADVYTNKLYASRKDFKGFANSKSFIKKNKDSTGEPYLAWLPDDDVFHDSSFTVEMFVKIANGCFPQWTNLFKRNYENQSDANAMQFWIGNNSGEGILHNGFTSGGITDSARIDDSSWHHIAVVFDKATNKLSYYRDWQQVGVDTSITETIKESNTPIYILGHGTAHGYMGKIDEVRITKRALAPREFLSPDPPTGLIIIVY